MVKIIDDIKAIVKLSRRAYYFIRKRDIENAKEWIEAIEKLDLDELRQLETRFCPANIRNECLRVLRLAQEALEDLKQNQFNRARQAVRRIIILERRELLQEKKLLKKVAKKWDVIMEADEKDSYHCHILYREEGRTRYRTMMTGDTIWIEEHAEGKAKSEMVPCGSNVITFIRYKTRQLLFGRTNTRRSRGAVNIIDWYWWCKEK